MGPAERDLFEKTALAQQAAYERLTQLLTPLAGERYFGIFPGRTRGDGRKKFGGAIQKRAQEIARYVLPVATFAYLYHTVSGITLFRYWRLCESFDAPTEQREVVGRMVEEVLRHDPLYEAVLQDPLPLEETPEFALFQSLAERGQQEETSGASSTRNSPAGVAPRGLEGQQRGGPRRLRARDPGTRPRRALRRRGDPARPRSFEEPAARRDADADDAWQALPRALPSLVHVPQEALPHGRQPGPAPPHDAGVPAGPSGIPLGGARLHPADARARGPEAHDLYRTTMVETWEAINELRSRGVPDEYAAYLLPNAVALRFTESADLLNLHHKFAMRLCYNAQEEIWRALSTRLSRSARSTPGSVPGSSPPAPCATTPRSAPSVPRATDSAASSSGDRTPRSTCALFRSRRLTFWRQR